MPAWHSSGKTRISLRQTIDMLAPYVWSKIFEQIKSVWIIVVYLLLFQTIVLGVPVSNALVVAFGIGVVIVGLAFFTEGLFLGLMPLGETCGVRLPQKTVLPVILVFAFMLGLGATFAEPAIGVLKTAGASVKAWDAPLLFLLLNKYSGYLVITVGLGVAVAVLFGMLRFLYGWSLKPFIYIIYALGGLVSVWAFFEPNLVHVTGLAWDCGGVTTGPVTVPLVLALGIGISRVASKNAKGGAGGGFGVVTLASAFPILSVMTLAIIALPIVPSPMSDTRLFAATNRDKALALFESADEMKGYCLKNASYEAQLVLFDWDVQKMHSYLAGLGADATLRVAVFGSEQVFYDWVLEHGSPEQKLAVYGSPENVRRAIHDESSGKPVELDWADVFARNSLGAVQAILPLSIFLVFVLIVILREKLKFADEVILGVFVAVIGMSLFNIGIELGLSKIGKDVGTSLPSSFKAIEMPEQAQVIGNFDSAIVNRAIGATGETEKFFFGKTGSGYVQVPYDANNYDPATGRYSYTPVRGPLFGFLGGILMILFFSFMMGYGATLAEPALIALGTKVEELTVGTFKKKLLIQSVGVGVGIGIGFGVLKIIYDLPLIWMLLPPYALLMILTMILSEDFVNIGWDGAGVTTGPVTVPLVLAIGLGIGGQVGVTEGFGIIALASVWPVLTVLLVSLYVTMKRNSALREATPEA
jgi:hypothetical protein